MRRGAPCPVCGCPEAEVQVRYTHHSHLFEGVALVECTTCRLVFIDPLPDEKDLIAYNQNYFQNAHGGVEASEQAVRFFRGIAAIRLQHLEHYLSSVGATVRSVLEIGPGSGYFAAHFLRRHPEVEYAVIESDQTCHATLASLKVDLHRDLEELAGKKPTFDLLVMSHVLEHLANPVEILSKLVQLLRPGGAVFIEVPCRDHEFKAEHEPHLFFFDKPSMGRLLENQGLAAIQLSYHGKDRDQIRRSSALPSRMVAKVEALFRRLDIVPPWLRTGLPASSFIEDLRVWAAVKPYDAHAEKIVPAWWLRALARKS